MFLFQHQWKHFVSDKISSPVVSFSRCQRWNLCRAGILTTRWYSFSRSTHDQYLYRGLLFFFRSKEPFEHLFVLPPKIAGLNYPAVVDVIQMVSWYSDIFNPKSTSTFGLFYALDIMLQNFLHLQFMSVCNKIECLSLASLSSLV